MMPKFVIIAAAILSLSACGDDSKSTGETSPSDATGTETSGETASTLDTAEPDTAATCPVGSETSATTGADGAVLQLCGTTLTVPADAAPSGTSVTLKVVAPPGPAPFEQAFVSPAFEVGIAADFNVAAQLFVPDPRTEEGYRMAAYYESALDTWSGFEACPSEGGVIFPVTFGGVYALLRDTIIFPASPNDLGSGTMKATFKGETVTWDFVDGYAIHDFGSNGLRAVTLIARRTPAGGQLQHLDIRLSETADHAFVPLQVSLIDTADLSGGYTWLEPVDGPPTAASLIAVEGDRIVGTLTVTVHKGEASETMAVDIQAQTGRFRFPPEGACFPEG